MPLNLRPLLSELSIKTKDITQGLVKFPFDGDYAWAQVPFLQEIERQYNAGKPVRIIVLKARQLGISTATEGVIFNWMFLHPGANGLIVAQEAPTASEIFQMTKTYWESWPLRRAAPALKYDTKAQMRWAEINSSLRVATAKNATSGRGTTIHALHATEIAFYDDPYTLFTNINQTLPYKHGTIAVLESTANGQGNYWHEQWLKAETGETSYVPLFFPWYKHPEYRMQTTLCTPSELDADEKRLLLMGATYEAIAWRRWAINDKAHGDIDIFMQEYPSTPNEAFITSGRPIFSPQSIMDCYRQATPYKGNLIEKPNGELVFERDGAGYLTIFKNPVNDNRPDRYFIGGDSSMALNAGSDYACMQVINRQTHEQVAIWRGKIDPTSFGQEMAKLGRYYNTCMVCPEVNWGGQAAVAVLITKNYPQIWRNSYPDRTPGGQQNVFGWYTNYNRKQWAISTLKKMFIDRSITIHDPHTKNELLNYVDLGNMQFGNADGKSGHDDTVMALAIAVTASIAEGPFIEGQTHGQDLDLYGDEEFG